MYVIGNESENPLEGEWRFLGQVDSGINAFCLDATTFTHDDKLYYVWAQKNPDIRGNSSLYIAQVKRKFDLVDRENYNKSKKSEIEQSVPTCPPEKEEAIKDALKWLGMI